MSPTCPTTTPTYSTSPFLPGAILARVRPIAPGFAFRTELTIREIEAPRRLVFDLTSLMKAREVCTFEPVDDATLVRFETNVSTTGGPLAPLIDRWFVVPNARRQMERELLLMKKRLES